MANNYFKFKKFVVYQQYAAMKVCTDSCLFGAWVAQRLKKINALTILDLGAGTGLLSLMLAQKSTAKIFAIEMEKGALADVKRNFQLSLWEERLHLIQHDARNLILPEPVDFIICNPPFYDRALPSETESRNIAVHSSTLSFQEVAETVRRLLAPSGHAAVMTPFFRENELITLMLMHSIYPIEICRVRQTTHHNFFRSFILFSREAGELKTFELSIHTAQHSYTAEFSSLLKDYYLNL